MARALPLFFVLITILLQNTVSAAVLGLTLTPENPVKGDVVVISGTASPGEEVRIDITFEKVVAVNNGEYVFSVSGINIPNTKNRFTVTAYGCLDLDVSARRLLIGSLYLPAWVTLNKDATNGVATISQSVPAGTYDVIIRGKSGESTVRLKITATGYITADENGKFSYTYDTSPLPPGEFVISAGGVKRVITLSEKYSSPATSSGGSGGGLSAQASTPTTTPTPVQTPTPEMTPTTTPTLSPTPANTPVSTPKPEKTLEPNRTGTATPTPISTPENGVNRTEEPDETNNTASGQENAASISIQIPGFEFLTAVLVIAALQVWRGRKR
ncbi:hypothetical protein [Geoglobus acetivorans]|uniref:Uncharacterized protein n=1 Tax=Geoglobus acetivorans TaxID=565033 RepID=A0ABZ3H4E0_GEOAI|nr:hypothetical protein [Geoglobus acetivorans]